MDKIILTTKSELRAIVLDALKQVEMEKSNTTPPETISIQQAAQILGVGYKKVKSLIASGSIKTNKAGKIIKTSLNF